MKGTKTMGMKRKLKRKPQIKSIVDTGYYNIIVTFRIFDKNMIIFKNNETEKLSKVHEFTFSLTDALKDRTLIEVGETIKWEIMTTFMQKLKKNQTLWKQLEDLFLGINGESK